MKMMLCGKKTMLCGMIATAMTVAVGVAMAEPESKQEKSDATVTEAKSSAEDISIKDLKKAIKKKTVLLIDCNGSESYAKGHIPGAIDFATASGDLAAKLPADKAALVVAYCGGPRCMAYKAGVKAAEKLGYTNVKHFSAGISGWKDAGEKVEAAAQCPKDKKDAANCKLDPATCGVEKKDAKACSTEKKDAANCKLDPATCGAEKKDAKACSTEKKD